jgi:hypothetical protein
MKTTIIYLGLVALSFTNTIAANELKEQDFDKQQELTTLVLDNVFQENSLVATNQEFLKNIEESLTNDTIIFDPNSVVKSSFKKTVEEIIIENKLVTETKEEDYQPISLERTIEESIAEYNQIIESNDTNEVYPLDFEKINRAIQCVKVSNSNATITIDLKL